MMKRTSSCLGAGSQCSKAKHWRSTCASSWYLLKRCPSCSCKTHSCHSVYRLISPAQQSTASKVNFSEPCPSMQRFGIAMTQLCVPWAKIMPMTDRQIDCNESPRQYAYYGPIYRPEFSTELLQCGGHSVLGQEVLHERTRTMMPPGQPR